MRLKAVNQVAFNGNGRPVKGDVDGDVAGVMSGVTGGLANVTPGLAGAVR